MDMNNTNMYDAIQELYGNAFEPSEELDIEEDALSEEEYQKEKKKQERLENKNENIVTGLWVLTGVHVVYGILMLIISIANLSTKFIPSNMLYYFIMACLPLILWMFSTLYDKFNYHNRKFRLFYFALFNAVVCFSMLLFQILGSSLIPLFARLPVNDMTSLEANKGFGIVVLSLVSIIPSIAIMVVVYKQCKNEMLRQNIIAFKMAKRADFRKNTKYAYDMSIVRNLETGERYSIYEKDRFLHALSNGTTGTGKTSSCFTCAIAGDLETRAANLQMQKETVARLIEEGSVVMDAPMEDRDFCLDNFIPKESFSFSAKKNQQEQDTKYAQIKDKIIEFYRGAMGKEPKRTAKEMMQFMKEVVKVAGITAMAPNESFSDEIYALARAKGVTNINRVDPMLGKDGKTKPGFKGLNPLYINPKLSQMDWLMEASRKSVLVADVMQSLFDASGSGDVYFASVNKNVTVTTSLLAILVHPRLNHGEQPTLATVQYLIDDFSRYKEYRDKLVDVYAKKNKAGQVELINGKPDLGSFQMILDVVDSDMLGPGADKMFDQARGLRIIFDTFLTNPLIRNILCTQNTIDMDEMLARGDVTLVNYALELGTDGTAFGLFFLLSYIQAVLRRPGTEKDRVPNFFYVDELPVLLHPSEEKCFSLFRQYRVAMFVAIQSLSQMEKQQNTKFLKQVLMGNCAHHFVFGRVATEEMDYYEKLAGSSFQSKIMNGVKETPLTSDKPSVMYDHRETIERDLNISGSDIRARDFQEVFMVTVKDSSPVDCFFGKVSFLPKSRRIKKKSYTVDWKKYYNGEWEFDMTGTDSVSVAPQSADRMSQMVVVAADSTSQRNAIQKEDGSVVVVDFNRKDQEQGFSTTVASDSTAENKPEENKPEEKKAQKIETAENNQTEESTCAVEFAVESPGKTIQDEHPQIEQEEHVDEVTVIEGKASDQIHSERKSKGSAGEKSTEDGFYFDV